MKIKEFIKKNTTGVIIGAILFGGITGVVAATVLTAADISYTNVNNASVETAKDALDDLYIKASRLDNWIDPRGLNTDGVGIGGISFVYWNDNFGYTNEYAKTAVPGGSGLNGTYETRAALEAAYSGWNNTPIYIKTTKVNGIITGHAVCLWYHNREFCILPNYWDTDGTTTKTKLKADIEKALGIVIADSGCSSDSKSTVSACWAGNFYFTVNTIGEVYCTSSISGDACRIISSGNAGCA